MSIAFERSNYAGGDHRTERPGFAYRNMACASSIYNPQELSSVDQRFSAVQQPALEDQRGSLSSSSTSSIGENSDNSTSGVGGDLEEVQSECKGGPLGSLEALEEVLPVKKSISNFYRGKSKSFTSLSDAAHSSVKDITKPENAYTRKRKNLLTFNTIFDKSRNNILRSCKGGISKRSSSSKSMLALASTMNCSDSPSMGCSRPPLPPHARRVIHCEPSVVSSPADKLSSWRSFSFSDLQGAVAAEALRPSDAGSILAAHKILR